MARKININLRYSKNYKTEERAEIEINKLNISDDLTYVIFQIGGRFVPFFTNATKVEDSSWVLWLASKGFVVLS